MGNSVSGNAGKEICLTVSRYICIVGIGSCSRVADPFVYDNGLCFWMLSMVRHLTVLEISRNEWNCDYLEFSKWDPIDDWNRENE